MRRSEAGFDRVMTAVNSYVAEHGRPPASITEILAQNNVGLTISTWNYYLAATRRRSPETAALFYKAMGKPCPIDKATPEDTAEEPAAEEATTASPGEALAQVIRWLADLEGEDRARVLRAVDAFYGVG